MKLKKKLMEKVQRKDRTFLHGEDERKEEKKEKEIQMKNRRPRERDKSSLLAIGAESAVCHSCSGRIAEKDGDDGKDAAGGSSNEREQMDGGDSTKGGDSQKGKTGLK